MFKYLIAIIATIFLVGCGSPEANIKNASDAVVQILNFSMSDDNPHHIPMPVVGTGTGFFIADNVIVTNLHVVDNSQKLQVMLHNQIGSFDLEIIASSEYADIALVRIKDTSEVGAHPVLKFAPPHSLYAGQEVWAIGHPWNQSFSVTHGYISNVSRRMADVSRPLVQSDTKILNGNSGGPLLDSSGRVVAVNDMIYAPGGMFGESIAMSIRGDFVQKVISDLQTHKKYINTVAGIQLGYDYRNHAIMFAGVSNSRSNVLAAGLQANDLLLAMRSRLTGGYIKVVDLLEIMDQFTLLSPGDEVTLQVRRVRENRTESSSKDFLVTLKLIDSEPPFVARGR